MQVVAQTEHHESRFSEAATVLFNSNEYQTSVKRLRVDSATETTVSLEWDALPGVTEYRVRIKTRPPYPHYPDVSCTTNKITRKYS